MSIGVNEAEFYTAHCQRRRYDKNLHKNRKQWLRQISWQKDSEGQWVIHQTKFRSHLPDFLFSYTFTYFSPEQNTMVLTVPSSKCMVAKNSENVHVKA